MNQLFLDTLKEQYDRNKFKRFILEFFNQIDLAEKNIAVETQFSKHIDSLFFLGQYEDQFKKKVHLLEVRLKTESKLEQARTMQRNLIAKYLKDHWIDGALVAFYTSNSTSWRLSLVKVDYKFDDKGKTKEELSPAKRYSFLVGKDEPTHTAQNQLLKIFEQTTQNPALGQIEEAFSVEKVTKEFFEEYRKLFEGLVGELKKNHTFINEASKNNINTDNFAKKLLGQIVFLYFLQKKGWLGVSKGKSWGEGDRNFLRSIFDKSIKDKKNFFNNYLEKLFYDTLNNPRSDRVDRNYSEYFQSKIPFLNGGLFEPQYDWGNSLMYLDNRIFEQIFDVFDRYNFTVREDEPLEKEVAVDPEMLGKVFENLIEENLRRGKGTYYTPREIVHYMCRESLINYLTSEVSSLKREFIVNLLEWDGGLVSFHNDEEEQVEAALRSIKIVDPACGSGAFLVGMLQEILRARLLLSALHNKDVTEYQIKKETIQNCIYGVDIDPGAIEIAKLRLWLSLVVDYDLEEIEPLPNLDYKLMVGNSLIEKLDLQVSAKTNDPERNKLIDQLRELKDMYFTLSGSQEKKELRKQINELILLIENYDNEKKRQSILDNILDRNRQVKLFDIGIEQQTLTDIPTQIKQLDTLKDIKETDHFEWHLNFNEVFERGGFDVVIANPPYIDSESMSKNGQLKVREAIQKTYSFTKGNWDIYIAFFELGYKILSINGVLSFITPDKWISKPFGDELRKNTIDNIFILVRAGRKIFESAKVDSIISFFSKYHQNKLRVLDYKSNEFILIREVNKSLIPPPYAFDYLFSEYLDLLLDIDKMPHKLSDLCKCENACATSDAYKLGPLIKNTKDGYRTDDQLKIINTGTIGKFNSKWGQREMTYLKHKFLYPVVDKKEFFKNFKNSYSQKSILPKIIMKGLNLLDACIDIDGVIIPGKSTLLIPDEDINKLKFLLAILNSKLAFFYIKEKYPASSYNEGTTFTKEMINNLPIPDVSNTDRKALVNKVNGILDTKQSEDYVLNSEEQIDQLVYKLYKLTPEEIAIVEEKNG